MSNFQRVAYIRVSPLIQNIERQLDGMTFDKTFEEKISGRTRERPALKEILGTLERETTSMSTQWID